MKSVLKFIIIDTVVLFFLIVVWYFSCFSLGYASNSQNYQFEIWILYCATVLLHFILSIIIIRRFKGLKVFYLLFNLLLYIIATAYIYNYT